MSSILLSYYSPWIGSLCADASKRRRDNPRTLAGSAARARPVSRSRRPVNGRVSHNPAEWPAHERVQEWP
jgi:hypothetical protein